MLPIVKPDCRHFRGDAPCVPHKREGVHCADCPHYEETRGDILIIKLGAIGDVIRTTPLLRRLKRSHPLARIWWITQTPEILPREVDVRLRFDTAGILAARATTFETVLSLDKDREACALASLLTARVKKGFILRDGMCAPADADAEHKFRTGLFDDLNQQNTLHYVEEIFGVSGYPWEGEEYLLDPVVPFDFTPFAAAGIDPARPLIGLNTGCGGRWTSRLWAEERWAALATTLHAAGYQPLFLGGEQEDEKNRRLAASSPGAYLGHFSLQRFTALMDACDVVVSAVTMAMHIAIALRKELVLFNNIFNPREFELYGRGEILAPAQPCHCFFRPTCTHEAYRCMDHLDIATVAGAVERAVARAHARGALRPERAAGLR